MGAGGSLPNNFKCQEPPPLPPPFYTGNPQSGISRVSSCESSAGDRRASGTSTVTLGNPGFQDPRSSDIVKNEEWWHQRPSAPSLSSLRPQQETLLTYAAQMTGWQSGCGSGGVASMHQEAMELARTVSHLAAANQQLASAHSTLLAQLEALYHELNRERELRIESSRNTTARKRPTSSDEDEEKFKLADRLDKLEAAIAERQYRGGNRQSDSWLDHERELRVSLEELEDRLSSRKDACVQSNSFDKELEVRLGSSAVVADGRVAPLPAARAAKKRNLAVENCARRLPADGNRLPRAQRIEEIDDRRANESAEENLRALGDYQKAIDRIKLLENELENSCGRDGRWESEERCELAARDRGKIDEDNRANEEDDTTDWSSRSYSKSSENEEETRALLGEIERLKDDRSEYREINRKLTDDLENQKRTIEQLRREYEISRSQCEKAESRLTERKKQIEVLTGEFETAKSETSRLLREVQVFSMEKDTATARIAELEEELAKLTLEKEQIVIIENQESARLRKKLSEEIGDKREQAKALDSALKEIRRLNEIIEATRTKAESSGIEEIPEVESIAEEEVTDQEISVPRSSNMEEFRQELSLKREARQRAIAAVSSEMDRLRRELDAEKEAHSETSRVLDLLKSAQAANVKSEATSSTDVSVDAKEDSIREDWRAKLKPDPEQNSNEADAQALTDILKVSDELRSSIRLQTEKIDDLRFHLECEPDGHRNRIATLKGIADASREASANRERQINKLKNVLAQIIARLGDARFRVEITDDVRSEHDRQIEDIRRLRGLYDERLRVLVELRDSAFKELADVKDKLKGSRKENGGLEEDLRKAEEKIDTQDTEISNLESQLGLTKADCRDLQNQMSVINSLFTQMLLSASSADMDLDRLTRLLQENHDLISDMAREEGTEAAALPKLLLDIVEQVEGRGGSKSADGETEKKEDDPQEENIAHNLPKVWRVLLELLSCHAVGSPAATPASLSTDPNSCYKSVDTPSGPRLVISVSKTYIRLKELILEKKHLEKEMNRMKQLNTHLESKLGEQEKRLSTVSSELSKTWNVVGRMQAQHQQLHTHEKILRYELQQKRKMLQELKQELEYCREKWESARQKNTNTEIEWRSLRREFAARKSLAAQDSFNNSGESGFSDERGDDSDEEDAAVGERVRIGPRRRARKMELITPENPRAQTPDTESEQPTDTELSESKTGSTSTPEEQRTPTPETAIRTADISTQSMSTDPKDNASSERHERVKPMNPLDQALANVIQNLITTDEASVIQPTVASEETQVYKSCTVLPFTSSTSPEVKEESISSDKLEEKKSIETGLTSPKDKETDRPVPTSGVSVFSIGPFPTSSTPPPSKTVQFSDPLIVGPSTQSLALPVFGDIVQENEDSTSIPEVEEVEEIVAESLKIREEKKEDELKKEEEAVKPVSSSSHSQESIIPDRIRNEIELPSTSTVEPFPKPVRTHEEVLAARADRLKRLEEQADWLMKKMNATSIRGSALNTRLEELHEVYGEAPVPPPMPDILPNVRIPSDTETQQTQELAKKTSVEKAPNETPPPDSP